MGRGTGEMNHDAIDAETVTTPAGHYEIEWIHDESAEQPYDEGFVLVTAGGHDRIPIDTDTDNTLPYEVLSALGSDGQRWAREEHSSAAIVRYLSLTGKKGVTAVDEDYRPVESSTNRYERVHGVAWAPDDVPADRADSYVRGALAQWQAWATGDVFGYEVTGPDGRQVDACWGLYGYLASREYTMGEARGVIDHDVAERVESANRIGAGFVGIV